MISIPSVAIVTAPVDGRVRRLLPERTRVSKGDVVGSVAGPRGSAPLVSPATGEIHGMLVADDAAVFAGEGVVWLSRR